MKKKIIISVIPSLLIAAAAIFAGISFLSSEATVSGQESRGWRVWIRTEPCAGRHDWLSVAKDPGGAGTTKGLNTYVSYDTFLPRGAKPCTESEPFGCTFAEATALMESLRGHRKFFDFCCRDYSVWENIDTRKRSVVVGKFGTAGERWSFVKGDLCCEEAESLAGVPGACSGSKTGKTGHIGCYKDTSAFDLDGFLERSRMNTPERCIAACRAKGFKYAGVQYGESCLCGNSYGKYGKADNCNYKCTGDSSKICGGYNANSVYATGAGGGEVTTTEIDLSGTWYNTINVNGRWDHAMILSRASTGKWTGTTQVWYQGQRTAAFDYELSIEALSGGRISVTHPKQGIKQNGTYTKDKIVIVGANGPMEFTRR
jgi:hypothetical protein